jgi:hypothetical protein
MNSSLQIIGNLLTASPENSGINNKLLSLNKPKGHYSRANFAIIAPLWYAKILLKPTHRFPTNITNQFFSRSRYN